MIVSLFPDDAALEECLQADRHALRRRLRTLQQRRSKGGSCEQALEKLWADIRRSQERLARRQALCPTPQFPEELPVSARRDEIADAIARHRVVILCGETGSGKSTQLPKICLQLGRGISGYIGHTQPRRIAARSLAARISEELGREPGTAVGYKVRFSDRVGPDTHIKLMTDGILLAEIQQDRYLNAYDTLIIDEAHERSLNVDFLLGYLKQLLPRRPDLKLIITSATIDPQRFSRHFDTAPVLEVSGRGFPVEVRYRPPPEEGGERDDPLQQAIVVAVDELSGPERGDILVFLSGEREIRETAETLHKHRMHATEVLPLYARLSASEQARVFQPHVGRRIILATNVAETSLTVPGIRYVIDTGLARISRYSHRSQVQRLPVERIAQSSAEQRKGRCGRIGPGICIRLFAEEDFATRPVFTEPEIQRTNLAAVILQMKQLGFGEIRDFPFIDPPDRRLIKDGYRLLLELGALDGEQRITRLGRQLARLPVDPRIARMLLAAAHGHCLREVLVIAAALSVQDPRERPLDKQQAADEAHAEFRHEESDFLFYWNLWRHLEQQRLHLSRSKFRRYCQQRYLSWNRVREWEDIHQQLRAQLHEMGYRDNETEASYEEIHRALLSGLLSHIGFLDQGKDKGYMGAGGSRFWLFPGSTLFKAAPKWVMAAERVETTRPYARTLARIQPAWVEAAAGHLLRHSYSEPHWEARPAQVAAYQKTTLYGLTLHPRRKINYGPINPTEARELFIRFALVEGDFKTRAPFFRHNRELIDEVRDLECKARREDILVDEEARYAFYDTRVPEGIYSGATFEAWLRQATRQKPKLLHMRLADLRRRGAGEITAELYPDALEVEGSRLPLKYHFDPGQPSDGVMLMLPLPLINQVSEGRCEWLVPGLLREKVIALLRTLPKPLRKALVPVPDYADACLKELQPSDQPLAQALAQALKSLAGVHIPEDAWQVQELPPHLRMNFQLLDEQGQPLAFGKDLTALRQQFGDRAQASFRRPAGDTLERDGIRDWDFGELPEQVEVNKGALSYQGFPALVDRADHVAIRLLDSRANAAQAMRTGLRRLFMLRLAKELRYLQRNLPELQRMRLQYAKAPPAPQGLAQEAGAELGDELVNLAVDLTFIEGRPMVRTEADFHARLEQDKGRLMTVAREVCGQVAAILERYQRVRQILAAKTPTNWEPLVADMRQQLDALVYRGFLLHTPWPALQHFSRYLEAIERRRDKLTHAAGRDLQRLQELEPLYRQWQNKEEQARRNGKVDERLEELRWHFEELRVSLFAQELKTAYPISLKRLERRWQELGL